MIPPGRELGVWRVRISSPCTCRHTADPITPTPAPIATAYSPPPLPYRLCFLRILHKEPLVPVTCFGRAAYAVRLLICVAHAAVPLLWGVDSQTAWGQSESVGCFMILLLIHSGLIMLLVGESG